MAGFGIWENIFIICIFGFIFFAMLPFANSCLDYLVRTNIADELQGRAWGFIGFISQIGYVVAYALSGAAADWFSVYLLDGKIYGEIILGKAKKEEERQREEKLNSWLSEMGW